MNKKEAVNAISFLQNKKEVLLANLQIQVSKSQTATVIFISIIACLMGMISIFLLEDIYFLCRITFIFYFLYLIKKRLQIKILSKKIFCVGSLISWIYVQDLKVDRKGVEEILKKDYKNFNNLIKKARKERWA